MGNVIAICLVFCGVVLFTHLLVDKHLTGKAYSSLVIVTFFAGFLVSQAPRIIEFTWKEKELSVKLREVQQIRDDVYAKAEAVKRLGEYLANVAAWNISTSGRFPDERLQYALVQRRDELIRMLTELGTTPDQIAKIVEPINGVVLSDLIGKVRSFLHDHVVDLNRTRPAEKHFRPDRLVPEVWPLLLKPYDRAAFVSKIKALDIYNPAIEPLLDDVDRFINTKTLK